MQGLKRIKRKILIFWPCFRIYNFNLTFTALFSSFWGTLLWKRILFLFVITLWSHLKSYFHDSKYLCHFFIWLFLRFRDLGFFGFSSIVINWQHRYHHVSSNNYFVQMPKLFWLNPFIWLKSNYLPKVFSITNPTVQLKRYSLLKCVP